jgi:hypothetical protein
LIEQTFGSYAFCAGLVDYEVITENVLAGPTPETHGAV